MSYRIAAVLWIHICLDMFIQYVEVNDTAIVRFDLNNIKWQLII